MALSFDNTARHSESQNQFRQALLDMIKAERAAFKRLLDTYYASKDQTEANYAEVNEKLISSLERVFAFFNEGGGESSLFLCNMVKPLKKSHADAVAIREAIKNKMAANDEDAEQDIPADSQVVYITLYQTEGHNIAKWEAQLRSLSSVIQTRPIYEQEEDAKKAVRARMSLNSEGYVSVIVKKSAIIKASGQKTRVDKSGRPLVVLMDATVSLEHIIEFALADQHYRFVNGKLKPMASGQRGFFGQPV